MYKQINLVLKTQRYYPIPGVWQHFRYLAFYSTTTEPPVLKLPQNMRIFGLCLNIKFFFEKVDERWRRSTSGAQKRKVPGDWKRCNGESHQNVHLPHRLASFQCALHFGRRFKPITSVTLHEHTNHFSWLSTRRNMSSSPEFCIVNGLQSMNVSSKFGSERTARSN